MKRHLLVSLLLLTVAGCQRRSRTQPVKSAEKEPFTLPARGKPITIFVHGGAKPFSALIRLPGLYDVTPQGFFLSSEIPESSCLGRRISLMLNQAAPERFPLSSFYVYGWSGLLSAVARQKAGNELYHFIAKLRSFDCCKDVPLTIVAYSHGGNVALSAAMAAWEAGDTRTLVDRLIIMACPVVTPTQHYIPSPMFDHVIALYSKSDPFQVSDFQGLYTNREEGGSCSLFSNRRFDPSTYLAQAEVKMDNRSRTGHLGFIAQRVLKYFPQIIDILEDPEARKSLPVDKHYCYCVNINTRFSTVEGCTTSKCRSPLSVLLSKRRKTRVTP